VLFDNEVYAILIFDLETLKLLDVNDTYCRMYGYGREELLSGMTIHDITDEHQVSDAATQQAINEGTIFIPLRYHRKKDGTVFPVEIVGGPYTWRGRKVMFALSHDITARVHSETERKKAEAALREGEARLREVLENSLDASYKRSLITDTYDYMSPSFTNISGYTPEEMNALPLETIEKLIHSNDLAEVQRVIAESLSNQDNRPYRIEYRFKHKQGHYRWIMDSYTVSRDRTGQPLALIGSVSDITERRQADAYKEMGREILQLLNEHGDLQDSIQQVLTILKTRSGFDAVGIRLQDGDDFPYYAQNGFSEEFMLAENTLIERAADGGVCRDKDGNVNLECTCGQVISGKHDTANTYFTQGGSCWTNDESGTPFQDTRLHPRDRCLHDGFQSVALVPIHNGERIVGLIQLNDRRKGCLTLELVELLEGIAAHIGVALMRKKAEQALRESDEKFRKAFSTSMDPTAITRFSDGVCVAVNKSHTKLMGYEEDEIVGKSILPLNIWVDPSARLKMIELLAKEGVVESFEAMFRTKSGVQIRGLMSAVLIELNGVRHIINTTKDITEQAKAQEALSESEEKYRLLVENSHDIIYTLTPEGIFIFVSTAWTTLLGHPVEEVAGHPFQPFVHPDDIQGCMMWLQKVVETRQRQEGVEYRVRHVDGSWRWHTSSAVPLWDEAGTVIGFEGTARDITDRKRLDEEQQRVAKLESVGLLAGGIAHDFNNILTSIVGNISLAKMDAAPGSELQNTLEQAEKASQRATALTKQLLTFSKGGAPVKNLASLTELIKDTVGFALSGSKVKCHFSMPADLWHAEIDAGQISQVIHNLVINAQQAMPTGGSIEISAENIDLSKTQNLGKALPLKEGDYVRIAVADHGIGIPKDHLEKIFDPFFTTKHKGNGLGLATSFSIAHQHGGHISVESELGAGSTFYIYLPASPQKSASEQDKQEQIKPVGKARILVMDDEQSIKEVAGHMLQHIGYKDIEFAVDGEEAIKMYKAAMESSHPFSVVILDLTIPGGKGGEATIRELLKIDPSVKAIVSSGYVDDPVMARYKEHGFSGMVAKPYTLEHLRKGLQDVIG